jgi:hypothetical protein
MVDNSPWEAGSLVRLAEHCPEEGRARPVVVAAVAAAVAVVVAAAGAQTTLSRHRATHYVYQNRRSAVGHMSHRSSKSRATDPPQANANEKETHPLLTVSIAIFSSSAESSKLRNRALLTQLTKGAV